MTLAFVLSTTITLIFLNLLWLLVDTEAFNPTPQRVVRIFKYSEIQLPHPLGDIEYGLSAYPILQQEMFSGVLNTSVPKNLLKNKSNAKKTRPSEGTSTQ